VPDVLEAAPPIATTRPCEAHGSHRPEAAYREFHHVIPQAWQHLWVPPTAKVVWSLWDRRTVSLCRTGHGNVHVWIVRFMREWEAVERTLGARKHPTVDSVVRTVTEASRKANENFRNRHEMEFAALALSRWNQAGGDLRALCGAGLYGEI
jgi:hypothetical protein